MVVNALQIWWKRTGALRSLDRLWRKDQEHPYLAQEQLDAAKAAAARGDHEGALRLWAGVRAQFPGRKEAYADAIALLRELRRLDDAEQLILLACDHFPDDSGLASSYAQNI